MRPKGDMDDRRTRGSGRRRVWSWIRGTGRAAVLAAGLSVAVFATLRAQESAVPMDLQIALAIRVLDFDRARAARDPESLVVAVVHQRRYRPSLLVEEELTAAVERLGDTGLRSEVVSVDLDDTTDLGAALAESGADLVYVAPLRAIAIETVTAETRAQNLLSFTGTPDYVERGVSIGVDVEGGRPRLLVNLEGAQEEGAELNSQLLQLSRVVRTRQDT